MITATSTQIVCDKCGHAHTVKGDLPIGRMARCAGCKQMFLVNAPRIEPVAEASPAIQTPKQIQPKGYPWLALADSVVYFCLMGALVVLIGFMMASPINVSPDKFKADNAYGATANAVERIEKTISKFVGIVYFMVSVWIISKWHRHLSRHQMDKSST